MEKAPGVQLEEKWPGMDMNAKLKLIKAIGKIQKTWASNTFSQYGSIYYPDDLETPTPCVLTKQDGSKVVNPRFSVGPSTSREQFDGGRMGVDFDRGPCEQLQSCF